MGWVKGSVDVEVVEGGRWTAMNDELNGIGMQCNNQRPQKQKQKAREKREQIQLARIMNRGISRRKNTFHKVSPKGL